MICEAEAIGRQIIRRRIEEENVIMDSSKLSGNVGEDRKAPPGSSTPGPPPWTKGSWWVFLPVYLLAVMLLTYMPSVLIIPASEDPSPASFVSHMIDRFFAERTIDIYLTNRYNSWLQGFLFAAPWVVFTGCFFVAVLNRQISVRTALLIWTISHGVVLVGKAFYINAINQGGPMDSGPLGLMVGLVADVPLLFVAAVVIARALGHRSSGNSP